jgi:hypothetical protein
MPPSSSPPRGPTNTYTALRKVARGSEPRSGWAARASTAVKPKQVPTLAEAGSRSSPRLRTPRIAKRLGRPVARALTEGRAAATSKQSRQRRPQRCRCRRKAEARLDDLGCCFELREAWGLAIASTRRRLGADYRASRRGNRAVAGSRAIAMPRVGTVRSPPVAKERSSFSENPDRCPRPVRGEAAAGSSARDASVLEAGRFGRVARTSNPPLSL